jgi:hypothetical protein
MRRAERNGEQHPEYCWQKPLLREIKAGPWTLFQAARKLASSFADGSRTERDAV